MIKLIDAEWNEFGSPIALIKQFVLDSAADVADLPEAAPGSVAIVAQKGGAVYIVNASGEWKEL